MQTTSTVSAIGVGSIAKAKVGSWIVLAEYKMNGNRVIPLCVKSEKVDGKKIKADTWYKLEDGEFEEVSND